MAKWTKPDGTQIDIDADDKTIAAIGTIVKESLEPVVGTIGDTVKSSLTEALKPINDELAAIKAGGGEGGEADPKGKAKPKAGDEDPVAAALAKLNERLDKADAEKAAEQQSKTTTQRVDAYLAKNHPNADPKKLAILRKRAIAAAPKDDAALKAAVDDAKQEMADMGIDVAKALSASPAAEGAKASDPSADQVAEQKRKNMERLRKEGPGGLRPASK